MYNLRDKIFYFFVFFLLPLHPIKEERYEEIFNTAYYSCSDCGL